jgi:antitoxin component HigA of HigAB toxin-antitoxin module
MNLDAIKIQPITNETELTEASKIIDLLIDADLIEDPIERTKALDILEAVTILACEYEEKHYPIPKPNPREAIKKAIEQLHSSEKYILARKNLPFLLDELHAEAKANGLTEGILAELLLDNE